MRSSDRGLSHAPKKCILCALGCSPYYSSCGTLYGYFIRGSELERQGASIAIYIFRYTRGIEDAGYDGDLAQYGDYYRAECVQEVRCAIAAMSKQVDHLEKLTRTN